METCDSWAEKALDALGTIDTTQSIRLLIRLDTRWHHHWHKDRPHRVRSPHNTQAISTAMLSMSGESILVQSCNHDA